jgi:glycosyltransferase involved in cell wall biosynthesis
MRIAVDLQACQTDSRDRGIGRYAMSLVGAMSKVLQDDDELIICIDTADTERMRDVRNALRKRGIHRRVVAYGYPYSNASELSPTILAAAAQLRAKFFESICPDLLLIPSFFEFGTRYSTALDWNHLPGIPTAVIAHDIIPLLFPERYLPEGASRTGWYLEKLKQLQNFDLLLANSDLTRQDLIKHLKMDPSKIKVIGAGFDRTLLPNSNGTAIGKLTQFGIRLPFVLTVGNGDWRKNTIGAVQAFADLPRELRRTHQLVLTQVGDDVREALKNEYRHLRHQVVVLGKVHEEDLGLLYSNCRVFFFPSFYEGFGFPVLEAMAMGAPTLSSCLGSLPEVVHNRDMLFDPRDRKQSAAILQNALEDETFRESLKADASKHAMEFTWERCADSALQAIKTHSEPPKPGSPTWPNDNEIAVLAGACLDAGWNGVQLLENGLKMIENGDRRRVLVDITEIVRLDLQTGIQRVTRNFCVGLAEIARTTQRFTVEPFVWTEAGIRYARHYARTRLGMECSGVDDGVESRPNDLVFMLDSSWWSPERFNELHCRTWELGGEVVWMVHDLVPIKYPQTCDPGMPPAFRAWLSHAVLTADGFICNSEATRADLEAFMDEVLKPRSRRPWSSTVHLGTDLDSRGLIGSGEKALDVLKQIDGHAYFAALGTIEPRKDYGTILDAFDRLWIRGCDVALVIMGKKGWNVEELVKKIVEHPENGRRLFWIEGAADKDVLSLLKHATALIQASIAEGFGLPIVEAGSQGIPLLLSDIAVFHEIAGEDATYFPVGDAKTLAALIERLVHRKDTRRPKAIKAMTWLESAERLANVLL